jgi:hypothetical protein
MKATEQQQDLTPEVELSVLILHYFEIQDRQIEGHVLRTAVQAQQVRKKIEQLIKGKE